MLRISDLVVSAGPSYLKPFLKAFSAEMFLELFPILVFAAKGEGFEGGDFMSVIVGN